MRAPGTSGNDAIATLAYELWLGRGCPDGSPEQDWYEAERVLNASVEVVGTSTTEDISSTKPAVLAAGT